MAGLLDTLLPPGLLPDQADYSYMLPRPPMQVPRQPQYAPQSDATDFSARSRTPHYAPAAPAFGGQPGGMAAFLSSMQRDEGLIPALIGAAGGPTPYNQQIEQQRQVYQALAPVLGPQKAMLAIMSPDAYKLAFPDEKPMDLGQGYVYQAGKGIYRAFEPDDKLPSGYRKADASKGETGELHYLTGGPEDPAVTKAAALQKGPYTVGQGGVVGENTPDGFKVLYKNEPSAEATLDDDTTALMAKQYIATMDPKVFANLGRGAQGAANVIKLRKFIKDEATAQGLDGEALGQRAIDYASDLAANRSLGTQEGKMTSGAVEAQGALKIAREASAKVPRGNWVPINKAIQFAQSNTGDPNIRAFGAAVNTLVTTYAKAINPTGVPTVDSMHHAREMLSTADGPEAFEAVLQQMDREIEMAHKAPAIARGMIRKERQERLRGDSSGVSAVATEPSSSSGGSLPPGWGVTVKQ